MIRFVTPLLLASLLLSGCREDAHKHIRRAKDKVFEKQPQAAIEEYGKALEILRREDSAETQVLRARVLRGWGDIHYLETREMAKAVEVYKELITTCPEAPETLDARINLANILRVHYNDLRGAIAELTAAIARNPPQGAELVYQVAKLYFELGDYKQCDLEAQNLVKRFETSAFVDDALFLQAQALSMMDGRRPDAVRVFQGLAQRFPDSDLQPHALFEWGKLSADAGENEQAIELWVESLKRHPDPAVVQSHIARVRARIANTTPRKLGSEAAAFDRDLPQQLAEGGRTKKPPKTSIEAVGGSEEEAAREASDSFREHPGAHTKKPPPTP
ncbi:MAG: tetratricopeptide repeat protein [Myxococcaceae bacterium]